MNDLNSKQRATLRAKAAGLQSIFQVGKGGIGENMIRDINGALEAHELVKITVLRNSGESAEDIMQELATKTRSETVCSIGSKVVLYRKSHKDGIEHVL